MFKKEYLDQVFQFVMFIYVIINDSLDTEINKAKSGLAHESFKKTVLVNVVLVKRIVSHHETIIQTGITCKEIPL